MVEYFERDRLDSKNKQPEKASLALSNKNMPTKVTLCQQLSKNNDAKIIVTDANNDVASDSKNSVASIV